MNPTATICISLREKGPFLFCNFPVTACVLALGCPQSSVGRQITDPENFEVFVRNYQDMVFSTALRLLGNPADAEDIAQTVFLGRLMSASPNSRTAPLSAAG